MDVDWSFAGFVWLVASTIIALAYRKRLLAALGTLLFQGVIQRARDEFFDRTEEDAEDGTKRVLLRPNARLEALASAVAPAFTAAVLKSLKLKPAAGGPPIGPGGSIDFGAALALLPKRYQGYAALALPLLQKFGLKLGGGETTTTSGGSGGGWA